MTMSLTTSTIHRDKDDLELYKSMSIDEETFDKGEGPVIVAYRHHVTDTGTVIKSRE